MHPLEAVLLGIVQGLTEFLPVSSTAHLTLAGKALSLVDERDPAAWTAFIAVMQLGTLAAVVLYFRRDLLSMGRALGAALRPGTLRGPGASLRPEARLALLVLLGTLPVAAAGLALSDLIHGMFTKNTLVIVASLVGLALLLWLAEKKAVHRRNLEDLRARDALFIGLAQALALIPGASRSGTTITAGLFAGLERPAAARFSFLLSVPAVFASGLFEMLAIDPAVFRLGLGNLALATVVSCAAGYAAIAWLLRFLSTHSTMVFVWYRIGLGALLLLLLWGGFFKG
ncbi:MAG: undecaprenyl-diphosphatase UppP [Bacteroidota bacterium]